MTAQAILDGILMGLPLSISIGPSFFALIQTSIKSGFRSSLALATGIIISDALCVLIAFFGASQLFDDPRNKTYIGIIGGVVLVIFGCFNFFQKQRVVTESIAEQTMKIHFLLLKGFVMNILNPFVIIFWLSAVTLIGSKYDFEQGNVITVFAITLLIIFASDVLKAFVAHIIRQYLRPRTLSVINKVASLILVIIGISLIYRVIV